jgi:asparagine synthase (glutamine-hydrolysing)
MCGIFGIKSSNKNLLNELNKMHLGLIHRGPDNYGYYLNEESKIGMGHNRLSILDLSEKSNQPFENENYVICYNGEIYNYLELRDSLKHSHQISFKTEGDFEVLCQLWLIYGIKFLDFLDGMFAITIFDKIESKLYLIRDRFGEKPLYYKHTNSEFIYASEIKAFDVVSKEPDIETLSYFVNNSQYYNESNPSRTFYQSIKIVQPSHYLIFDLVKNEIREKRYYSLRIEKYNASLSEASLELNSLLLKIIGRRLRSDVDYATLLSGGLDSNVLMTFQNILGDTPNIVSAIFPKKSQDESSDIFKSLEIHKTNKQFFVQPTVEQFQDKISQVIKTQDEPFGSTSVFAQHLIFEELQRNGIKMAIDGQGADEIFAGYHYYFDRYFYELSFSNWNNFKNKINKYKSLRSDNRFDSYLSIKGRISNIKKQLLKNKPPTLNDLLEKNLLGGELQEMLRYGDRNSMHSSIELRSPFLSHELIEFVFKLPNEFKLRDGFTKYILRKVAAESPFSKAQNIIWSTEKKGFVTPFSDFTSNLNITNKAIDFTIDHGLDPTKLTPWKAFMIQSYFCE